ncbi:carbon-phosphorus lyase complex subunit PhnI [Okeania sp.]|uniref:carbon-phosphorus lyase complex subunit PhnI n=1 Tax=Okeania sp. TaxID=3100323 RepID=UPI002B4B76D1|nr:carbon-phosphorus lyase complex subunit PhnI [Okeania sp.]MEB3341333.1 carbon-phosphorus lyase complex subunit PhnI [Okeania sp.]
MALLDRAMQAKELGEEIERPAQDPEFVFYHSDNVQAQGFVQHLKLPHYINFQAEINLVRKLQNEQKNNQNVEINGKSKLEEVTPDKSEENKFKDSIVKEVTMGKSS